MPRPPLRPRCLDLANLSASEADALALTIGQLLAGGGPSAISVLALQGCNLGLLCGTGQAHDNALAHDIALVHSSALALGARVACLSPDLALLAGPMNLQPTAHVIGRLYDALVCIGSAGEWVRRIGEVAGVPLIEGLAAAPGTLLRLANLAPGWPGWPDNQARRRLVVQAVLLHALA